MQCQFPQAVSATVLFASGRFGSRGLLLFWVVAGLVTPAGEGRADLNFAVDWAVDWAVDGAVGLAAASLAQGAAGGGARTWTDNTGKYKIEAELVDCRSGTVRLKKTNGKIISLPLSRLSAADRQLVEERTAKPSGTTQAKPDIASWVGKSAVIEFVSGAKSQGRIVTGDEKYISVEVAVGTRKYLRKYPLDRIHAVTIGAKREVLNAKTDGGRVPRPGGTTPQQGSATNPAATVGVRRTSAQVNALIDKLGGTPPDWWESVPLDYPRTIDLSWPKYSGPWNPNKNVGQFMFSVINENPRRWKQGTKFMHHVLSVNKDNPKVQQSVFNQLGHCYHDLLRDWARAAFWWRKLKTYNIDNFVGLADCYWKLGNKEMAAGLLRRSRTDYSRYGSAVKLWSDMGELDKSLQLAEASARAGNPGGAYMGAGDACRKHGRYSQAVVYYRKVLAIPTAYARIGGKNQKNPILERNKSRAQTAIDNIKVFETLELKRIPDGTYTGTSLAYLGDLTVAVTVQNGRITSVRVTKHKDKQYFSALTDTPNQIIENQGLKGVDATTGATITSEAVINAAAKALSAGMK